MTTTGIFWIWFVVSLIAAAVLRDWYEGEDTRLDKGFKMALYLGGIAGFYILLLRTFGLQACVP
jgi:hypothetical protein